MSKHVAITIAGAVSLGSYEAGVMFEVLDALRQHNQWADANDSSQRIEIDVLTGASAGGMTAAMTALGLLFDQPEKWQPYNNPMYQAWVEQIDIEALLSRDATEDATCSVFSSNCVVNISKKQLTPDPAPATNPHPALRQGVPLSVGLALSNLNGVDYARKTMTGGEVVYTKHQDQHLFRVDSGKPFDNGVWDTIRKSAVACGAFPVAFRAQDVERDIDDYADLYLRKELWGGKSTMSFCYTDGGVFYNQPLGMAMNLVQDLPGGRMEGTSRGYLFIAPRPKSSDAQTGIAAQNANFKTLAHNLVGAVMDQSEFRDWVTAEEFNKKLDILNKRAAGLLDLYQRGALDPKQTTPVTDLLLQALFTDGGALQAGKLDEARQQLQQQFSTEYATLSGDKAAAWRDAVLVLEFAADLHCKEETYIYDFVAEPEKLAGGSLFAFTGFFDKSYRDHDYDYGRTVAQQRIKDYAAKPDTVFTALHWVPQAVRPVDPKLDNLAMQDVNPDTRNRVCAQLLQSADTLMKELGMNYPERAGLKTLVVEKQIKKMLAL